MCERHETTNITKTLERASANKSLVEAYNENGIFFLPVEETEEELRGKGYIETKDKAVISIQQSLQRIPNIIKDIELQKDIETAFTEATEKTYKCVLDPTLKLGKSNTLEGAFKGLAYDENGCLKTQADWIPNDAMLDISKVPQIATSIFNMMAFASAQYYLPRINNQLNSISDKIDRVLSAIDIKNDSELKALVDDIKYIDEHITYIDKNHDRINNAIIKINRLTETAERLNYYFAGMINNHKLSNIDDKATIKSNIKDIEGTLYRYNISMLALIKLKFMSAHFCRMDPEELTQCEREVFNIVADFESNKSNAINNMRKYIANANALKRNNGVRIGNHWISLKEWNFSVKKQILDSIDECDNRINNYLQLELPNELNKIEIVSVNGKTYLRAVKE